MSLMGTRVVRTEDPRLLTSGGVYTADVHDPLLEGGVHAHFVRSTVAHATISGIDTDEARSFPGVVAVVTHADLEHPDQSPAMPMFPAAMKRTTLATGRVRFVGEPVAVVLAETPAQAADAAEQVIVDYEPLPAVVTSTDAAADTTLLFQEAGTNTVVVFGDQDLDPDLFAGCEVVTEPLTIANQRVAVAPLEVRSGAATWADDGRLHVFLSTQHTHGSRDMLCGHYGLSLEQVRVVAPDVGGGFGGKISLHSEELLLPELARVAGRPVRWTETRTENMLAATQGRDQRQTITIGGTRDGKVKAYRLDVLAAGGAYPVLGAFLPFLTRMMAPGTYDIEKVECRTRSVVTNTTPVHAYRGAGRPEATSAIERAMDLFAAEIGMDPAEVRRRNVVGRFDQPYTTAVGTAYDSGAYEEALDRVLAAAGYDELRAEQQRRRDAGGPEQLGIGVSSYVEVTGGPGGGSEDAAVVVHSDGTATVLTGTAPHGQGHATAWAMIASDRLGIPFDKVALVANDTDRVPAGGGTFGSRSLQQGGVAVGVVAEQLLDKARQLAADLLEANVADVQLDPTRGVFHVAGSPAPARTWAELAAEAERREAGTSPGDTDSDTGINAGTGIDTDNEVAGVVGSGLPGTPAESGDEDQPAVTGPRFDQTAPTWGGGSSDDGRGGSWPVSGLFVAGAFKAGSTYPFGAHVAVVEVDTETGGVRLVRAVSCDDAGVLVNPLLVEGQRHGGMAQGAAQALMEEVRYDDDGNPLTSNLADYAFISAAELPSFELVTMETPTPVNPLGVKGIGESGTIGSTPAVHSAVCDALAHLGVRHVDMPTTAERVWRAVQDASGS